MSVQKQTNPNFQISVKVSYIESESRPEENYHLFGYKITVHNKGQIPAQLMSRHWIITDGTGETEEVRGAGVVGLQPKIKPQDNFEYESVCPMNGSSGTMKGFYQMLGDNGETFDIEIPEFYLIAPSALH